MQGLIVDFGRAALRPASTDLVRLADRRFHDWPDLERAFLDGYGDAQRLAAAIGTAVWAYGVGDEAFELEGRRAIDELLAER